MADRLVRAAFLEAAGPAGVVVGWALGHAPADRLVRAAFLEVAGPAEAAAVGDRDEVRSVAIHDRTPLCLLSAQAAS